MSGSSSDYIYIGSSDLWPDSVAIRACGLLCMCVSMPESCVRLRNKMWINSIRSDPFRGRSPIDHICVAVDLIYPALAYTGVRTSSDDHACIDRSEFQHGTRDHLSAFHLIATVQRWPRDILNFSFFYLFIY